MFNINTPEQIYSFLLTNSKVHGVYTEDCPEDVIKYLKYCHYIVVIENEYKEGKHQGGTCIINATEDSGVRQSITYFVENSFIELIV